MELKLNKPICFFDLEATGNSVTTDRIVEIAIFKIFPNGNKESKTWLVNPTIPIPEEISEIHHITNEKVANEPIFKDLAPQIYQMIKGSDLAGYNSNKFDIPLLAEEFLRANMEFDLKNTLTIDVQNIFHKMEQRTLSAAYRFYCNKDLEDAHSAKADTIATYEVLKAQIDRYDEIENNVKQLSEFSSRFKSVDLAGFIVYNDKEKEVFNFGKYKGKEVETILEKDPGYFGWVQNADFPLYTKRIFTNIKLKKFGKHQSTPYQHKNKSS